MISQDNPELPEQSKQNGDEPKRPHFMYVYYLTEDENPPFPAYFFRLKRAGALQEQVERAVEQIINKEVEPEESGSNGVSWTAYSHMVFVLNAPRHRLTDVKFQYAGDGDNHSFGRVRALQDFSGCSALYCINKRLNHARQQLGPGDDEVFVWTAIHDHPVSSPQKRMYHTASGTNVGP